MKAKRLLAIALMQICLIISISFAARPEDIKYVQTKCCYSVISCNSQYGGANGACLASCYTDCSMCTCTQWFEGGPIAGQPTSCGNS